MVTWPRNVLAYRDEEIDSDFIDDVFIAFWLSDRGGLKPRGKIFSKSLRDALTPQLMVCYLRSRHYALSQVRVS